VEVLIWMWWLVLFIIGGDGISIVALGCFGRVLICMPVLVDSLGVVRSS